MSGGMRARILAGEVSPKFSWENEQDAQNRRYSHAS